MENILLTVHLIIVTILIGAVLLQPSQGAGGIVGGMGGGLMSSRGTATFITRLTLVLAAGFFVTSIALAIVGRYGRETQADVIRDITGEEAPGINLDGPISGEDLLGALGAGSEEETPSSEPITEQPASGEAPSSESSQPPQDELPQESDAEPATPALTQGAIGDEAAPPPPVNP